MDALSLIRSDILTAVAEKGFTTIYADADEAAPPYAYTVGLCAAAKLEREVIVFGLPGDVARHILNTVGTRLAQGEDTPLNKNIDGVLVGYPIRLIGVPAKVFANFGRVANWYAREILKRACPVEALQLLWPDSSGIFPNLDSSSDDTQPLLQDA